MSDITLSNYFKSYIFKTLYIVSDTKALVMTSWYVGCATFVTSVYKINQINSADILTKVA